MPTLFACLLAIFFSVSAVAEFEVPALRGPVNDYAGILSRSNERVLTNALVGVKRNGKTEIAILTVPDLGGVTIEQASIAVAEAWKLGSKESDNGVILMISKQDRRLRIEVGQGLEGLLTDAYSKRIIEETMVPLLRSGDTNQAVLLGAYQIAKRTNPDLNVDALFGDQNWRKQRSQGRRSDIGFLPLLFLIFIGLFLSRFRFGRYLLFAFLLSGRGSGRGFGGGGFGGGGFGGGGGGFSGGGASGGW